MTEKSGFTKTAPTLRYVSTMRSLKSSVPIGSETKIYLVAIVIYFHRKYFMRTPSKHRRENANRGHSIKFNAMQCNLLLLTK